MPDEQQPAVTLTQPKIAFFLSLITLAGIVYTGTDKLVRYQVEFDTLKNSYIELAAGQEDLKIEVQSLRNAVNNEIRHMAKAVEHLSQALDDGQIQKVEGK